MNAAFPVARVLGEPQLVSFQDEGRAGYEHFGISPSGCMDLKAAQSCNSLLLNEANAVVIEIGPKALELEFLQHCWIASDAVVSTPKRRGTLENKAATAQAFAVKRSEKLCFAPRAGRNWCTLAVAGSWRASRQFGSSSFHSRSQLAERIHEGKLLYAEAAPFASAGHSEQRLIARRYFRQTEPADKKQLEQRDNEPFLLGLGPHFERLKASSQQALFEATWRMSTVLDRSGYRLLGPKLESIAELESFAVRVGSLQLSHAGALIVTMPDGPTVGGYPVIAVLEAEQLGRFAQRPPGSELHFRLMD